MVTVDFLLDPRRTAPPPLSCSLSARRSTPPVLCAVFITKANFLYVESGTVVVHPLPIHATISWQNYLFCLKRFTPRPCKRHNTMTKIPVRWNRHSVPVPLAFVSVSSKRYTPAHAPARTLPCHDKMTGYIFLEAVHPSLVHTRCNTSTRLFFTDAMHPLPCPYTAHCCDKYTYFLEAVYSPAPCTLHFVS